MPIEPALDDLVVPEIVQPYMASLNAEIHPDDGMFYGDRRHYFSTGASALACILHAVGLAGIARPKSVLDFGCGAGRVTRWLRVAFPHTSIHACDVREVDLAFVKRSFAVTTWISGTDVANLKPPGSYDVIWVGSVFTHLSVQTSGRLFHELMGWLPPDGFLIFSVHGRYVLRRADSGAYNYGVGDRWKKLVTDYSESGYGYADYPKEVGLGPGYGLSLSKSAWWIDLIESDSNMRGLPDRTL